MFSKKQDLKKKKIESRLPIIHNSEYKRLINLFMRSFVLLLFSTICPPLFYFSIIRGGASRHSVRFIKEAFGYLHRWWNWLVLSREISVFLFKNSRIWLAILIIRLVKNKRSLRRDALRYRSPPHHQLVFFEESHDLTCDLLK